MSARPHSGDFHVERIDVLEQFAAQVLLADATNLNLLNL